MRLVLGRQTLSKIDRGILSEASIRRNAGSGLSDIFSSFSSWRCEDTKIFLTHPLHLFENTVYMTVITITY